MMEELRRRFPVGIQTIVPIQNAGHEVCLVTLENNFRFIVKTLGYKNWLGFLSSPSIEFNESLAEMVADQLTATHPAIKWPESNSYLMPGAARRILIIPYCEGHEEHLWSEGQAWQLGKLLARLHHLKLPTTNAKPFPAVRLPPERVSAKWQNLAHICNQHRRYEPAQWVTSHRDIHASNVIWTASGRPHLIDWESAGLIHPFVELIGLATNAAGVNRPSFNERAFGAVLKGYRDEAKLPLESLPLWQLSFYSWLLWLGYNLEKNRSQEVAHTINALEALHEQLPSMKAIYRAMASSAFP